MNTAILYAPDWPGDEVILVFDADEFAQIRHCLDLATLGKIGERHFAVFGRTAFAAMARFVEGRLYSYQGDMTVAPPALRRLHGRARSVATALLAARQDDRAGDPPAGSLAAVALAEA